MKKKAVKILSLLMSFVLVFSVMSMTFSAFAADAVAVKGGTLSGNKDISWTLNSEGVLTLKGKGELPNSWTFGKVGLAISSDISLGDLFDVITNLGNTEEYVKDVEKIVIGEGITSVGNANFTTCVNAAEIVLPSTLKSIGKNAFAYTSVISVKIPAAVTKIGESAFYGTNLAIVTFADNAQIKSIGKLAFAKTYLDSLYVSASVESISADACNENNEFRGFDVASSNKNYKSDSFGALLSADGKTFLRYPDGADNEEYTIPSMVSTVKTGAFTNKNLVTLRIPYTVKTMEKDSFNCPGLREVYNLSSVKLTPGTADNGGAAKYALVIHTSSSEPTGFYSVGDYKFVTDGKKHTLYSYTGSDTSVSLPTDIVYAEKSVLAYTIGKNAFSKSSVKSVVIPAEVLKIDAEAFSDCASLENVSFADGSKISAIDDSTFSGCKKLVLIALPDTVSSIGKSAFKNCSSLSSFELPDSVTAIGESAFEGCSDLNIFVIASSSSLESIGKSSFKNDVLLNDVNFPETLTTIGESAFQGCESLESVTLPASVKTVGVSAFADCTDLSSVVFAYDSVLTSIREKTFKNCTDLKEVIVPSSVEKINEAAFEGCTALSKIYICNKDCCVDSAKTTIPDGAVIYGHNISSAKNYSVLRRREFKNINLSHVLSVATCTKPSACYVCGQVVSEAEDHCFSEWEVVTPATCTKNGVSFRVCSVCGEKETRIVSALGHTYDDWYYVTDPDTGIEFKERICTVCLSKHIQSVAVIDDDNPPEEPEVNYITGDVNGDGKITAQDARLTLRFAAKLESVSYVESKAADVNGDGKVTAFDARKILRVSAQLEQF